MTEADVESIWDTTWETARFDKINVRIAEFINFKLYRDSTTQCTNTAVLPLLEQFSEEVLLELNLAAKANKFVDTWGFIQANVSNFLIRKYQVWREVFDEILKTLGQTETVEVVNLSGFGSSNTI